MNKVVITTISSMIAILIVTVMLPSPILATIDDEEMTGDESIDECAQKFNPEYDRERFQRCHGGIGDPMN